MRSSVWRVTLVLACVAVVTMATTDADAARRSALAGNQLIEDFDDVFAFPHLANKYNHTLMIDYAPYSGGYDGSGSVIFGSDEWALNVNTGRVHNGDSLPFWAWGGYDQQLYGGGGLLFDQLIVDDWDLPNVTEWWDIGFAWGAGGTPMGVQLGITSNSNKRDDGPDGDTEDDTDNSRSIFDIQYSIDLGSTDVAASFSFGSITDKQQPTGIGTETLDIGLTQFSASARGEFGGGATYDWGWLLNFAYASASDAIIVPDASANPVKESSSALAFSGSIGPKFGAPASKWVAAAYLTLDYTSLSWVESDVSGYEFGDMTMFTLPGWNMAGEYYVAKWLAVRGGVRSRYEMVTEKGKDASNTAFPEIQVKSREFDIMWTAGLGLKAESWGLDMYLNPDQLHSGYLPGGAGNYDGDDVFGLLSMWVKWGKTTPGE